MLPPYVSTMNIHQML